MNKIHNWVNTGLVVLVATLVLVGGNAINQFGGTTNYDELTLDDGTLVLNGGAFCIDLFATSTETRGQITASSTATIEGVDGVMMFEYGSCQ